MIKLNIQQKETFAYKDKVEFHSTVSYLDGKKGTLMGTAAEFPGNNFWIVKLDEPMSDRSALVITDSCIKLVH